MKRPNVIDYNEKYINDNLKQLRKGSILYVWTKQRCNDIEHVINNEGLNVTKKICNGYWIYKLKEETK
jgi:TusA-related sulfurtransferase